MGWAGISFKSRIECGGSFVLPKAREYICFEYDAVRGKSIEFCSTIYYRLRIIHMNPSPAIPCPS